MRCPTRSPERHRRVCETRRSPVLRVCPSRIVLGTPHVHTFFSIGAIRTRLGSRRPPRSSGSKSLAKATGSARSRTGMSCDDTVAAAGPTGALCALSEQQLLIASPAQESLGNLRPDVVCGAHSVQLPPPYVPVCVCS